MNDVISVSTTKTYIMAYEIDKKYKGEKFEVVLYQGESTKSEIY